MANQKKKHRKHNNGKQAHLSESNLSQEQDEIKKRKKKRKKRRDEDTPIKFKPLFHINPGIIAFLGLFVYLIIMVVMYYKSEPITPYEVKLGSLAVNNEYTGLVLREETVVNSDFSGYINYYARENEKVSAGSMIYTVDSTGKLSDMLENSDGDGSKLSNDDLNQLKNDISLFSISFKPEKFIDTYDFKYDIQGTVLKLANSDVLANIDELRAQNYTDSIDFGYAPTSGIIIYSTDGYEERTVEDINDDLMNFSNYEKNQYQSNDLIAEGDGAYKLITSELWSVIVEIDESKALSLENENYVEVRFLKNNYKPWAAVSVIRQNGKIYAKLDFNNSMVTFCTDRFLEIEILDNAQEGLKIPMSAVVDRPFYLIPLDYMTYGNNLDEPGFIKESYMEDGSITTEFVAATIYNSNEKYYYVDQETFSVGDYIIKPETGERYDIREQATLKGVYNINKGYADFKQIIILNNNDEYAIVKSNSEYGLNVYDHIVLNGDSVSENDFIYE